MKGQKYIIFFVFDVLFPEENIQKKMCFIIKNHSKLIQNHFLKQHFGLNKVYINHKMSFAHHF